MREVTSYVEYMPRADASVHIVGLPGTFLTELVRQSVRRVRRGSWGARDELGRSLEWVEPNLGMRAASIRRDEGEGVIPGDLRPPWVSCGAIQMVWWGVGIVDGAFGRNGIITFWIHFIFVADCMSFVTVMSQLT